tara:strand:+ start:2002 stop:2253 length:252 start_codon:yes stop_codon:yes gene_type:complete
MPQTEAQKRANKKYRESHREKIRAAAKIKMLNAYYEKKDNDIHGGDFMEKRRERALTYYHANKERIAAIRKARRLRQKNSANH